jgi:hypothetical protein
MAQTNYTPISLYYSTTASAVPTAANLVPGELAINTNDGKLYYEDSSGVVQVLATKSTGSIGGSNTQVQFNNSGSLGGSSGLTWDGSFLTTSSIKNTALTSGRVTFAGASGLLTDSATLQFNANGLGIGAAPNTSPGSPYFNLNVGGGGGGGIISSGDDTYFTSNLYITGGANYFASTGPAYGSYYNQSNGNHLWLSSTAAGAGGTVATVTEKMRLTAAGNVGIGTSSPSSRLEIVGVNPVLTINANDTVNGRNATLSLISGTSLDPSGTCRIMYGASNSTTDGTLTFVEGDGTERMRIDPAGNLGLGVTPSAWNSAYKVLQFSNSGAIFGATGDVYLGNNIYENSSGTNTYITTDFASMYRQVDGKHLWYTSASGTAGNPITFTNVMSLDAAGDLLLGTTSNTTNGGFILATNFYGAGRSVQVIGHINGASSGDAYMIFNYNGTGIGSITQSGTTAVLYNTTSDQRLKTNIVDAPSGNIDDIKVRSFDWIADGSHQEYGMVAQELIEVAPYAVNKPENPDEMMGVDYSKLVPMMIKEIQGLKQRIATLENK